MDTGSDSPNQPRDPRQEEAGEGTFADVYNSFTFDGGWRGLRRKKSERNRNKEARDSEPEPAADTAQPGQAARQDEAPDESAAAIVRPYAWTRGRTRSDFALELETLVSTSAQGQLNAQQLQEEHYAIVRMCGQPRSVAEIAALLSVPLGVVRVLVGDMAELGLVHVHETTTGDDSLPNMDLMERVLIGLRRL